MLLTRNINQLHSELFSAIVLIMKFIVFEGLDGSGKSSLMRALQAKLQGLQLPVYLTREPGGTELGDQLRELILKKQTVTGFTPVPRAELLMYEASRAQHVDLILKPYLQKKYWILCDRFTASSVAFQAGGRSIAIRDVEMLNAFATQDLQPDLTILLDLSVQESKKRRDQRSLQTHEKEDRMEAEAEVFHERVRQSFLTQSREQKNWLVLDAAFSPDELLKITWLELVKRQWVES